MIRSPRGTGVPLYKTKCRAGGERGLGVRQTGSLSPRSGSETVDGLSLRFIKPKFRRSAREAGSQVDRGCSAGWKTRSTGSEWIGGGGWVAGSAL